MLYRLRLQNENAVFRLLRNSRVRSFVTDSLSRQDKSTPRAHTSAKANLVQIRMKSYPGDFQI